jgi:Zn-dependent M28 family amino/carboxypeptidase
LPSHIGLLAVLKHHLNRPAIVAALLAGLSVGTLAACGGADASSRTTPAAQTGFDGAMAMANVRKQTDFGPRVPGTPAHKAMGDWLIAELRTRADTVVVQEWTHTTADGKRLPMRNVLARFRPTDAQRVLYLAHWDSRPTSDQASDPAQRLLPVPGANDGGSGVAILLGVADALKKEAPPVGVDLLFVDGEDWGSFDTMTDVLIGARYFAEHLPDPGYAPLFGVLFDMVGDEHPVFEQEAHSLSRAPEVVQRVWTTAQRLGYGAAFTNREGIAITDDHVPLLDKGLRVIDVIDLDYPWHHTPEDTADKVFQSSLQLVGDVALTVIRDLGTK